MSLSMLWNRYSRMCQQNVHANREWQNHFTRLKVSPLGLSAISPLFHHHNPSSLPSSSSYFWCQRFSMHWQRVGGGRCNQHTRVIKAVGHVRQELTTTSGTTLSSRSVRAINRASDAFVDTMQPTRTPHCSFVLEHAAALSTDCFLIPFANRPIQNSQRYLPPELSAIVSYKFIYRNAHFLLRQLSDKTECSCLNQ